MEEKILRKGEPFQTRKVLKKVAIWWTIIWVVDFAVVFTVEAVEHPEHIGEDLLGLLGLAVVIGFGWLIISILSLILRAGEITVTDKRVYGIYGSKRVDLPIDSVSAVSCSKRAVCISTASGMINFKRLKNAEEIYDVVNSLLLQRQKEKKQTEKVAAPVVAAAPTKAAELKEFKELLDSGIITQEEFDAKRKELLGL